ncbi:CRE-CLEC-98 protein [Caenorhabditis remanei]|uniref:CRE-CLEC-98 protein n=1 Tax=Caenorhabditis remanei TaxID=31234 RepID=E3M8P8_CAERE|nr:CRE-CLEC-98 protein [Caenorhabditis remanei]
MRTLLLLLALIIGSVVTQREYRGGRGDNGNSNNNNRGCESGWQRFNRPTGGYCIKVYRGEHTQPQAEARCQSVGAKLTGVVSQEEISWITKSALSLISQSSGSIWLGAKRTNTCNSSPLSSKCTSMNSFYWSDRITIGTSGLIWNTNQPDNSHAQSQQCVVLLAARSTVIQDKWTWYSNRLDDVACGLPSGDNNGPRAIRAYACGKGA